MSIVEKLEKLFGDPSQKHIKRLQPIIDAINALETVYQEYADEELANKTTEFKQRLEQGETLDDLLVEAFAVVREASRRVLGQRHYDVQLIGGIVLHRGMIAEMRTGEGKTLTSTLPVYLNALAGKGVHVVTVNDYLARRDASWMGQVYNFLGLTVGCIQNQHVTYIYDPSAKADVDLADRDNNKTLDKVEEVILELKQQEHVFKVDMDRLSRVQNRREAYQADIIYGTNNEFGFDYLRDNMVFSRIEKTQRDLTYALIDEVDSILIDEARTPLIISAPDAESTAHYYTYKNIVAVLQENQDYNIDEKMKSVSFTEAGQDAIAKTLGRDPWMEMDYQTTFHLEAALKAKALFTREKDYVVQNGEVLIVDEFTGRMMPGRRYSEGLHQALEAKEGLEVQRESKTLATITFQNYFRMYKKLAGMTGTAETEREEFYKIYGVDVIVIPTNKQIQRKDLNDLIFKNEKAKFKAVVEDVRKRYEAGQPVLVGTISIEKNEQLSLMLDRAGIRHEMLNAKNHEREAEIIAQAGKKGAVTLATNMAGRGVDIVLGGVDGSKVDQEEVLSLGGLHVIGTERHESRRIDYQLRGRTGRQGDVGSTQFFVCLEDDLMRIFGSDRIARVMETLKVPEELPIENRIITKSLESAQKKVEGNNFDIRKRVVEYDDVMNKQRKAIYEMRNKVLEAENTDNEHEILKDMIMEMIASEVESVVLFHTASEHEKQWDLQEIYEVMSTILRITQEDRKTFTELQAQAGTDQEDHEARTGIVNHLISLAEKQYETFEKSFEDQASLIRVQKQFLLQAIDQHWVSHLDDMQHLRSGIGLRGYAQKDPLVEFKKEGFGLFNKMQAAIQKQVAYSFFKISSAVAQQIAQRQEQAMVFQGAQKTMGASQKAVQAAQTGISAFGATPRNTFEGVKVGRNDDCPCGSGKKYKRCHGA